MLTHLLQLRLLANIPTAFVVSGVIPPVFTASYDLDDDTASPHKVEYYYTQVMSVTQFATAILSVVCSIVRLFVRVFTAQSLPQIVSNRLVRRLSNFSRTAPSV